MRVSLSETACKRIMVSGGYVRVIPPLKCASRLYGEFRTDTGQGCRVWA